jgi:hypothetical protein
VDVEEFMAFAGLRELVEMRTDTRAYVIAWRKHLESPEKSLKDASQEQSRKVLRIQHPP